MRRAKELLEKRKMRQSEGEANMDSTSSLPTADDVNDILTGKRRPQKLAPINDKNIQRSTSQEAEEKITAPRARPQSGKMPTITALKRTNLADNLMAPNSEKLEEEYLAKQELNRKLDNDFAGILEVQEMDQEDLTSQIENAFAGQKDYGNFELVKDELTGKYVQQRKLPQPKKKIRPMTTKYGRGYQKPALEPILEKDELNNQQLVPAGDHFKKQRNMLLKQKASKFRPEVNHPNDAYKQQTQTNDYAQDAGADTFLTGGGMPGECSKKNKDIKEDFRQKKYYKYEEDEMIDNLDGYEEEMIEMLKSITDMTEAMEGDDLYQIRQMMDVSKQHMNEHFKMTDQVRENVSQMNSEAVGAMADFADVDPDAKAWCQKNANSAATLKEKELNKAASLSAIKEEKEREENENAIANKINHMKHQVEEQEDWMKPFAAGGIRVGGQPAKVEDSVPLESQKKEIVTTLYGMSDAIRAYSGQIQERIDALHKNGKDKYTKHTGPTNIGEAMNNFTGKISENDKKMNALANQASHYLRKSTQRSTEGSQSGRGSIVMDEAASAPNQQVSQSVTALPLRSGSAARASSATRKLPEISQSVTALPRVMSARGPMPPATGGSAAGRSRPFSGIPQYTKTTFLQSKDRNQAADLQYNPKPLYASKPKPPTAVKKPVFY